MTDFYEWNGQTYRGAKAVAEAAGVSPKTVYSHLAQAGQLDRLGVGRGCRLPRLLSWQGKTYASVKAIADAAGVSISYVYRLIAEDGHLERLGAGRWQVKSTHPATSPCQDQDGHSAGKNRGCA